MEAVVAIAALIVGFASLFAAYQGSCALLTNRRLGGKPLADMRQMAISAAGRLALVLMFVALVVGLVGGCWLSGVSSENKQRHVEQSEKR